MSRSEIARKMLSQKNRGVGFLIGFVSLRSRLFVRLLLICACAYLYFSGGQVYVPILVLGMVLGSTLQDIGWIMSMKKNWELTVEITDWTIVERIANNDS
jgi:hypothetical protein